ARREAKPLYLDLAQCCSGRGQGGLYLSLCQVEGDCLAVLAVDDDSMGPARAVVGKYRHGAQMSHDPCSHVARSSRSGQTPGCRGAGYRRRVLRRCMDCGFRKNCLSRRVGVKLPEIAERLEVNRAPQLMVVTELEPHDTRRISCELGEDCH